MNNFRHKSFPENNSKFKNFGNNGHHKGMTLNDAVKVVNYMKENKNSNLNLNKQPTLTAILSSLKDCKLNNQKPAENKNDDKAEIEKARHEEIAKHVLKSDEEIKNDLQKAKEINVKLSSKVDSETSGEELANKVILEIFDLKDEE